MRISHLQKSVEKLIFAAFDNGISPIYTRNNKGPKTEPCGTLQSIGFDLLLIFFITTLKKRFFKKDFINLIKYRGTPRYTSL